MKKILLILILICRIASNLQAAQSVNQNELIPLIQRLDSASTLPQYLELANAFERAAQVDKKSWYPFYYASYCYTLAAFRQKDKHTADQYADKALELATQAEKLQPENSEITTLFGYVCQAKLSIYPMERSFTMSGKSNKYFEKAMKQDPANPRPYYLKAQNLFYTPAALGGGQDKACVVAQKAAQLYAAKTEETLNPTWGRKGNLAFLKKCQP